MPIPTTLGTHYQPNLNIIWNTNCDEGTCYSILNGAPEVFRTSSAQTGIICKFLLGDKMKERRLPRPAELSSDKYGRLVRLGWAGR